MSDGFVIDQEFADRMFQPNAACDEDLERSLLETGGPIDALHVAEFPSEENSADTMSVLMDGHRRYGICQKHGLNFRTICRKFPSRKDALREIDLIQLRRRNLNPTQEGIVRARLVEARAVEIGMREAVEEVAQEAGVASRTVWRDVDTAKHVDKVVPELHDRLDGLTKTDIIRLGELDPEDQREVVAQFDAGEFTSLKSAIMGESSMDAVIEKPKPKKKNVAPHDAAVKALGKLQDAIHDLNAAMPNKAHRSVARAYTDKLAEVLAAWGR